MVCLTWCNSCKISSDQTKVSNFQVILSLTREENVGRLQVPVDQPFPMNIDHCLQYLEPVEKEYYYTKTPQLQNVLIQRYNINTLAILIHKRVLPKMSTPRMSTPEMSTPKCQLLKFVCICLMGYDRWCYISVKINILTTCDILFWCRNFLKGYKFPWRIHIWEVKISSYKFPVIEKEWDCAINMLQTFRVTKKQVQGGSWISPAVLLSRLDHVQRQPLIQRNSISTRQNVTWHWIVWILNDLPVSPCLEIPDGPLGVGFGISWNEALGESR